jgi:hypothetical protein
MKRLVVWAGIDRWRAEASTIELLPNGVKASGTQIGEYPVPYRLDYALDASENFVTRTLGVTVRGGGWNRRLRLGHDGSGRWTCEASEDGRIGLPAPGGEVSAIEGAMDCDLGLSPMTNLMPVRRHSLHAQPAEVDFLMAWVSVPALELQPSRQRYEHVRRQGSGSVVRYVGEHRDYVGELVLDEDGLVLLYPDLARRVEFSRD